MRIPKEDSGALKYIRYNSEDYYGYYDEDEDCFKFESPEDTFVSIEYDNDLANEDFEYITDTINNLLKKSAGILTGSLGLWDGQHEINPVKIEDFKEDIIYKLKNTNRLEINFSREEKAIIIKNYHHDGVNSYELTFLHWYSKSELKEIADNYDIDLKAYYDEPYNKWTKINYINAIAYML